MEPLVQPHFIDEETDSKRWTEEEGTGSQACLCSSCTGNLGGAQCGSISTSGLRLRVLPAQARPAKVGLVGWRAMWSRGQWFSAMSFTPLLVSLSPNLSIQSALPHPGPQSCASTFSLSGLPSTSHFISLCISFFRWWSMGSDGPRLWWTTDSDRPQTLIDHGLW